MLALLRQRDFGLLWLAGLISYAGDFILIIAVPLHIYQLTGSASATAGSFAASFLPGILVGSLAGVFVDRWDRKRTMVVADLLRAALLLPVLLAPDRLEMLYTVAFVQGTIGLFFGPAEGALLPKLVGEERLVSANALNALNDNLGMLIGPALGSLLYASLGIGGAAVADAATFAVSALLIGLIAADGRPERALEEAAPDGTAAGRVLAEWRAGLSIVRRSRSLRVLVVAWSVMNVSEGVFVTLALAPFVLDVLGGTEAQVGWVTAAQAIGGMAAGVAIARIGKRLSVRWLLGGGITGVGIADFCTFNAQRVASPGLPAITVAMSTMAVAGLPAVASFAGRQALVQTEAPDAYRGRVFGAIRALQGVAMLVGLALGGLLGDAVGIVPVLTASAVLRMVAGVIALVFLPRRALRSAHAGTAAAAPLAVTESDGSG